MKPTKAQIALAAEAILGEEATSTSGYYGASWRIDSEHAPTIAAAALEAVLTDIEKRVATRIEEANRTADTAGYSWERDHLDSQIAGLEIALDILRGES